MTILRPALLSHVVSLLFPSPVLWFSYVRLILRTFSDKTFTSLTARFAHTINVRRMNCSNDPHDTAGSGARANNDPKSPTTLPMHPCPCVCVSFCDKLCSEQETVHSFAAPFCFLRYHPGRVSTIVANRPQTASNCMCISINQRCNIGQLKYGSAHSSR